VPENYFPDVVDESILLYTKMEILARLGNVPVGFINRTTWAAQSSPSKPLVKLSREQWDDNQLVPWIPISRDATRAKWVDIVVNNFDEKGHPFHLVRISASDAEFEILRLISLARLRFLCSVTILPRNTWLPRLQPV